MSAAVLVAVLVAAGVYLIFQRGLVRVAFGLILIAHAANVIILAAGGMDRREPSYADQGARAADMADPLLQAFTLTAIVITFALTVYLLAMAGHGGEDDGEPADADDRAPAEDGAPAEDAQVTQRVEAAPDTGDGDSAHATSTPTLDDPEDPGAGRGRT